MGQVSDGSTADYYQLPAGCTELQDLISYRNLNAQDGEIFRAIYRKGRASHSDELRDAKKVLFYAQAEVKRLEALQSAPATFGQQNTIEQLAVERIASEDPAKRVSLEDMESLVGQLPGGPLTGCVGCKPDDCPCLPDAELEKLERWKGSPGWAKWWAVDRVCGGWYEFEPSWESSGKYWKAYNGLSQPAKSPRNQTLTPEKEPRPCAN